MSRRIWSRELIMAEIRRLHDSGFDITQSRMEAIDSRLTSAAIRYFGSWRAAVTACGINYAEVAAVGRRRRIEKITRWTRETILREIQRLREEGENLTSTVVRRKHLSLYATSRRKNHFGSWEAALTAAGIDYSVVKREAREQRRKVVDWKEQLLIDYRSENHPPRETRPRVDADRPSTTPGWTRDLIRERLAEVYDQPGESADDVIDRLRNLIRPPQTKPN